MWRHNFVNGDLCLKTGQKNNITETTALNIYSWGRHLCHTAIKGNTTCQNLTGENLRFQAHAHKQLTPVLAFKTNTAFHEHTSGCLHKGLKGSAVSFLRKKSFSHTTSLASKSELLRKKKLQTLAVANNTKDVIHVRELSLASWGIPEPNSIAIALAESRLIEGRNCSRGMGKQPVWALIQCKCTVKLLENQSDADATDKDLVLWRPTAYHPLPSSFALAHKVWGVKCGVLILAFYSLCRRSENAAETWTSYAITL